MQTLSYDCILFCAVITVVSPNVASVMSSLTVPRSSVVLIGDRVEMKCKGSDWTKWTYTGWNTSTETDIYLGGQIVVSWRSRYKVNKNISEQHNLIIDSVDWDHAGRYRCIDVIQEKLSTDIQLTVLGSHPVCSANATESDVVGNKQTRLTIRCSITYTGNGFPVFNWTKGNAEKNIAANKTTSGISRGPVTNIFSIIQQLHANDNGVTFQCKVTFQMPNNSKDVAYKGYEYQWNYTLSVSSIIASVMSSSLTVPRSSVVLIGNRVELKCNGSEQTKWSHTAWNASIETDIYLYRQITDPMRSRYKADMNVGEQHNLIIDSVDLVHAGRYRCTAAIQVILLTDIQLTVLGSSPVCAANISVAHIDGKVERHLHLFSWCSISYTGNGFPVFSWTKSNAEKNIAADITTSGSSSGPFTNTSSIKEQLHVSDGGVTLQCQITFKIPDSSKSAYKYTWNYTLPYGPKNIRIVEYEDRLKCSADGNPTPTYRWTNVETNISVDGHVYLLNRTNVNEHTFECTATNTFGAESKTYTIKGGTPGVSDSLITAFAIGGSLLFLLITAIIVSFVVHRKRLKGARSDVELNTDLALYDDTALSSVRSSNNILEGYRSPGRSDGQTIADNAVSTEDMKPKGPTKGSQGGNIGDDSGSPQIPNQERKIVIGADGTEYAELSGVKAPAPKREVPKQPAFSQVEIYASIDHSGKVPAPPILPKL